MNLCPVPLVPILFLSASFLIIPAPHAAAQGARAETTDSVTKWAAEGRPDENDLHSFRLDLVRGGAMVREDEGLTLSVILYNKTEADMWVRAAFRSPGRSRKCNTQSKLEAGTSHRFSCQQHSLAPGSRYTIVIDVFASGDWETRLERRSISYQFTPEEIAALETFRKQATENVED